MNLKSWSGILVTGLCASSLIALSSFAEEQAASETESQAEAREILMDMSKFLSQTQRFDVYIRSGYDVIQPTGEKIEFNDNRKVMVSRPDQLRVETEKSNGNRNLALIDGKNITISSITQNVYAQTPSPGDLDASIKYLVNDLNMRLPLAMLLLNQFPAELEQRLQGIDDVEKTKILGLPTHHLVGRTETVDFQIWIMDGVRALPLRIVLTYKDEVGQPQYRAQFSEWNLSPENTDSLFTFTPPKGAQKINFLAKLNEMGIKAKTPAEPATSAGEQP